jgi:hypothetical protein
VLRAGGALVNDVGEKAKAAGTQTAMAKIVQDVIMMMVDWMVVSRIIVLQVRRIKTTEQMTLMTQNKL